VREMVNELKEFGVEAYGYDPLLSKEEIEGFGVKALDKLDVNVDGVIVAVAHDEFKKNPFLAQVLSLERKCADVRGIFDDEELKGFYYKEVVII
jgi:UDPglucose 6-dehydrogenase/UDP-N-acetyl-D-galactosamine dehydrogenase